MQKYLLNWMTMFMAATLLVGCGSENKDESAAPDKAAAKAPGSNSAKPARSSKTAEEVAEEARGDLKCPAKIVTSGRPANAPVDDVVGARPVTLVRRHNGYAGQRNRLQRHPGRRL